MGIITAFVIPFIVIPNYVTLPAVELSTVADQNVAVPLTTEPKSHSILDTIFLIYGIGTLIFFMRFSVQLSSLGHLIFTHKKRNLGQYKIVETTKNIAPFSFFNWIVYNPQQFNEPELEQIIMHEKVHAFQNHSVDILIGQISCIVLWFNPFIWFYNKALKQNLEFIADQTAIQKSQCKKSYQYTLLKTSFPKYQFALSNPFYNSLIKKRIIMLQQSKSKKINQIKYALVIPVLALFLMSFNTKTVYLTSEAPQKPQSSDQKLPETKAVPPLFKKSEETQKISEPKKLQEHVNYVITKNTSDAELDGFVANAKEHGVTLKIKGLQRNNEGEIVAIKIDAKSEDSNANYNYNSDTPIAVIKISFDKNGKGLSIGNAAMKYKVSKLKSTKEGAYTISSSNNDEQKIVIRKVKNNEDEKKAISVVGYNKQKNKNKNKNDNDTEAETILIVEDESPKSIVVRDVDKDDTEKVSVTTASGKEPLFVLDGKVVDNSEIQLLMPEDIEKINVLKGDSAIKKYGKKAEDGVVEITTKK
ncbi:M56 family metallopeptidase [Gaetbulibacter aestuarii]|uniref:M56 family metallopeptidase n=1 Tax=Gaetbulibacter aestuarii TaxID=1502358 RepID=A0ABW7MXN2_9FLAO